jgi:hypothetical protein
MIGNAISVVNLFLFGMNGGGEKIKLWEDDWIHWWIELIVCLLLHKIQNRNLEMRAIKGLKWRQKRVNRGWFDYDMNIGWKHGIG